MTLDNFSGTLGLPFAWWHSAIHACQSAGTLLNLLPILGRGEREQEKERGERGCFVPAEAGGEDEAEGELPRIIADSLGSCSMYGFNTAHVLSTPCS